MKFSLFHINGTYSRRTLFPAFGALGLISNAGFISSSFLHAKYVADIINKYEIIIPSIETFKL